MDGNLQTMHNAQDNNFYAVDAELADLGRERFDKDTAAIGDRDHALLLNAPVTVRQGRVSEGLEQHMFAWNAFGYVTDERDEREELKGDLHGGQLHRQNRAARGELLGPPLPPTIDYAGGGRKGGGRGRGRSEIYGGTPFGGGSGYGNGGAGRGAMHGAAQKEPNGVAPGSQTWVSSVKPNAPTPPLAKGKAKELDDEIFCDGPVF